MAECRCGRAISCRRLGCELTGLARVKEGRRPEPAAAVIGSQSIKTSADVPLASQATDADKKIAGRKRGVITDAPGLILAVASPQPARPATPSEYGPSARPGTPAHGAGLRARHLSLRR